jgi:hypothetical protein
VIAMTADTPALPGIGGDLTGWEAEALWFVAQMYALQVDQLAVLLTDHGAPAGSAPQRAREAVDHWRALGYAESGQLSVGEPWVWATRAGLDAFGLKSRRVSPGKRWLRHTHAVTDVRLALERTDAYRAGGAVWRSERQVRSQAGATSRDDHMPDAEVHWPAGGACPQAGEIWAVEVELSSKTVEHTARIMRQVLGRTGDYGCPPASIARPGQPPRYARLAYVCAPIPVPAVLNARDELGSALAAYIEVYGLPESAMRLNTPKRGW